MRNWPPNHSLLLHVDWPTIGTKAWCKALLDWARERHELKKYYFIPVDVDAPGNTNQDFRDISWTWFRIKLNHVLWTQSKISTIFNVLVRYHWQLLFYDSSLSEFPLFFSEIWLHRCFRKKFPYMACPSLWPHRECQAGHFVTVVVDTRDSLLVMKKTDVPVLEEQHQSQT